MPRSPELLGSPEPLGVVVVGCEAVPVDAGAPDELVDEELLELPPHAAMNAASPVAAAPAPIVFPAILRNFLRSTSSRASSCTAPPVGCVSVLVGSLIAPPSFARMRAPGGTPLYVGGG